MESTQSLHREASQSTLSVHVEPKHESASTVTPLLDADDATLVPEGWPTSPSRIKRPLYAIILDGAFDIALLAFSACFLVFSLVVMFYDGRSTSKSPTATSVLTRATKYGPTIFPLLFASVVGRATHAILLWRLEKGERIQILDTLATSTSLTSTVISQIQLRQINVLSVLLVVMWALSPIGGQASLRQMSIGAVNAEDALFRYVVPVKSMIDPRLTTYADVNDLFSSAVYTSSVTKVSPIDLWGNVKIPRIEYYEEEYSRGGWSPTSGGDGLGHYTSFVGIPTDGAHEKTTTTEYVFDLQTEYLQLTCARINHTLVTGLPDGKLPLDAYNITGYDSLIWWLQNDIENRSKTALTSLEPFNFTYVSSQKWGGESISCSVENSYVKVEVQCALNSTCQAVSARRSQLLQPPSATTLMDLFEGLNARVFMGNLMTSIGGDQGNSYNVGSILNRYLRDASLEFASNSTNRALTLADVNDEEFSERFGQLLNTFWTCVYGVNTITGGIHDTTSYSGDTDISFLPPEFEIDGSNNLSNYNRTMGDGRSKVWSTTGVKYERVEVIIADKRWAITLSIASLVLIVFSLVPPLVRHFLTAGPDIAMNFSSLATRNNTYVAIPAGGSFLPAADRFRLLKDLRLRFADAEGKSDVGNLVIAAQGVEKAEYSRVRKGRLYE